MEPESTDAAIVRALQADGRATYQDIARGLGIPRVLVSYRLQELLASGTVRVIAAVNPAFLGQTVMAHVSLQTRGPVRPVAGQLIHDEDTVLVSAVSGPHDLVVELRVGSYSELQSKLTSIRFLPDVDRIDTLLYTSVAKGFFISRYAGNATIDEFDTRLIELLQHDGRASYRNLATQVGLSPTATRTRVRRLLELRIIKISAVEERGARGRQLSMGVGLNLAGDVGAVLEMLGTTPDVEFAAETAGRFDAVITLAASSPRTLLDHIERLRAVPEIAHVTPWLHMEVLKEDYARRAG